MRTMASRILIGAGTALLIAGCGGGSGGGDGSSGGGDSSTAVTSGAITAFGSIVVNGRHLEIEGPEVEIEQDGDDVAESELELGMTVRVSDDDGGRHVEVEEAVRGPVDSVSGSSVTVMGQTVQTDAGTVFDDSPDSTLTNLSQNDIVEVNGLRNANDVIEASYIEKKTSTDRYTVNGTVKNHSTGAMTFDIGGLTVDYQNAELDDLPGGSWNGLVVEVKDAARTYVPGSASLVATKVEREDPIGATAGQRIEIERIVTTVNSDNTFEVSGGLLVRAGNAEFRIGSAADLVVGARVEIEGVLLDDNTLRATEIKFDDNDARLAGVVQAVDAGAGTLQVLGVTIALDDNVEFDELNGLGDLTAGADFVEVEGRVGPNGRVIAHEIELEDDITRDRELRGPVGDFDGPSGTLTLLGIDISVDGSTEFEADDDRPLTRSQFFSRLVANATIVEAKWDGDTFSATSNIVESVEIEDEDD